MAAACLRVEVCQRMIYGCVALTLAHTAPHIGWMHPASAQRVTSSKQSLAFLGSKRLMAASMSSRYLTATRLLPSRTMHCRAAAQPARTSRQTAASQLMLLVLVDSARHATEPVSPKPLIG
jgi:hypothetical protein